MNDDPDNSPPETYRDLVRRRHRKQRVWRGLLTFLAIVLVALVALVFWISQVMIAPPRPRLADSARPVIGVVLHGHRAEALWEGARPFLAVGLLGGLTTFSTFGYDTWLYLEDGKWGIAALNAGANFVLGIALVAAGLYVGSRIWPVALTS